VRTRLVRGLLSIRAMANENSGILDANALFADLPRFLAPPASSIPPSATYSSAPPSADVLFFEAHAPIHRRRDEITARSRRRVDHVRARLIAVIACGSVALVAALAACFLYAATPAPLAERSPVMQSAP